ncbi:MAG: GTP-binding protein [Xenococcaceae cyanobacterium MO_188.B32]|nr:GTP-binding protein [Xenococcaceae cyanobacterium MO_188.B32]
MHEVSMMQNTLDIAIAQARQNGATKIDRLAEQNRNYFQSKELLVINLLSSPGSGKTALIERILQEYGNSLGIGVIVGDLATENDARRLQSKGAPTIQITTGNACHNELNKSRVSYRIFDANLLIKGSQFSLII